MRTYCEPKELDPQLSYPEEARHKGIADDNSKENRIQREIDAQVHKKRVNRVEKSVFTDYVPTREPTLGVEESV
jgi:hypothetical protein